MGANNAEMAECEVSAQSLSNRMNKWLTFKVRCITSSDADDYRSY